MKKTSTLNSHSLSLHIKKIRISFSVLLVFFSLISIQGQYINRLDIVTLNDSLSVSEWDISLENDDIKQILEEKFQFDVCENCGIMKFGIPYEIDNHIITLKVFGEFSTFGCENCVNGYCAEESLIIWLNN